MKYKFLLLLLVTTIFHGQKSYTFDYLLEYDYKLTEKSKSETQYFFTNSKNNDYQLGISQTESDYFLCYLTDVANGIYIKTSIQKIDLATISTLNIDCKDVRIHGGGFSNASKKRYSFDIASDTVMNGSSCKHYILDYKKNRLSKKHNDYKSKHYIVEPGTDYHLPIQSFKYPIDIMAADNKPNGIAKALYSICKEHNKKEFIYRLKSITQVNTAVEIPANCEALKKQ